MLKKIAVLTAALMAAFSFSAYACPTEFSDTKAIQIAQTAMNTWFSNVEKGNTQVVADLFSPNIIILHSVGAPITKTEQINMLQGFHLGGYQFSDFCAARTGNTIVATFASKTFNQDISTSGMNFLSKDKAYRMVILENVNGKWLIIGYANTNPLEQEKMPKVASN